MNDIDQAREALREFSNIAKPHKFIIGSARWSRIKLDGFHASNYPLTRSEQLREDFRQLHGVSVVIDHANPERLEVQ